MLSYWAFSDVFEEQGVVKTPFYGGYGIVAERGIPKAAFRAFELLHQLGDERIANDSQDVLVTKRRDGAIVLALWNYAEPNEKVSERVFRLKAVNSTAKRYTIQMLDPAHGSALQAWMQMGRPATPSIAQIAKLVEASKLAPASGHALTDPIHVSAQGLALVTVR
jgi:xylan 1,4-beta-xylosidase